MRSQFTRLRSIVPVLVLAAGCHSPYYADRGALLGGLTGAGVGAIVGDATGGNAASGALVGAGIGAVTGAAAGGAMDEMEARTRAEIAGQLGRQVQPGAVTRADVVAMSRAGVAERLIVSHIRHHGVVAPATASDVIYLHEQGVSTDVIEAMQSPPVVVPTVAPAPVIVEEYHHGPAPCYLPPRRPRFHRAHRPGLRWGFSMER